MRTGSRCCANIISCALVLACYHASARLVSRNGVISDPVPTGFEAVAGHVAPNGDYQVAGSSNQVVLVFDISKTSGSLTSSRPTTDYLGVGDAVTRSVTDGTVNSADTLILVGESSVPQIRPTLWTNSAAGTDLGVSAQGGFTACSPHGEYGLGLVDANYASFRLDGSILPVPAGPSLFTAINDQGWLLSDETILPLNASGTAFDSAILLETAFPGQPGAFETGRFIDDDVVFGVSVWFDFFTFTTQEVVVAWDATNGGLSHTLDIGDDITRLDAAKAINSYAVSTEIFGGFVNLEFQSATGFSVLSDTLPPGFSQTAAAILTPDGPDILRITPGVFAGQSTLYVETLVETDASTIDDVSLLVSTPDQLQFSVIDLFPNTTNVLERSLTPIDSNSWHSVTSFVSTATHTNLIHPLTNATPNANYRIRSILVP